VLAELHKKCQHVQNGIVDGLERYLVYGLRLWMVWKGVQSTVWLIIVSVIESMV
jgi:hypothetical protein